MVIDLLLSTQAETPTDNTVKIAIISLVGVLATALLTFLSSRYAARKSTKASEDNAKITERQVDVSEWQALLAEIRAQAKGLGERVTELEAKDEQRRQRIDELEGRVRDAEAARDASDAKYRTAVRHIKDLLIWAVDPNRSKEPPVTPEELIEDLK